MIARASHLALLLAALSTGACVSQERYDLAVKDAASERARADKLATDLATSRGEIERLNDAVKKAQAASADCDRTVASLESSQKDFQTKLDAATAENQQLRTELTRLGKNADELLSQKGVLASALADAKSRLDELRKAQAAAESRTKLFKELALKFQRMVDAGQLKVALRNGRMVLQLSNDVLFDSGRTDIKPAGQAALAQVAKVLRTIPDRHFQVAGDTDNVPIRTGRFPSNWSCRRGARWRSSTSSSHKACAPRRSRPRATARSTPSPRTTTTPAARRTAASRSPLSRTSTSSSRCRT